MPESTGGEKKRVASVPDGARRHGCNNAKPWAGLLSKINPEAVCASSGASGVHGMDFPLSGSMPESGKGREFGRAVSPGASGIHDEASVPGFSRNQSRRSLRDETETPFVEREDGIFRAISPHSGRIAHPPPRSGAAG